MRGAGLKEGELVSACLLCFNDAETIVGLVKRAGAALDELGVEGEIVVVNDGSSDDSAARLAAAAKLEPRLRVVHHERNRGYGGAVKSAFATARGAWIFYTDGDGQYDPLQLALLGAEAGADVEWVQGYKRSRSDPALRRFVGTIYARGMRLLFSLPVRDVDCDFRLIRATTLRRIELESDSGAVCVELVHRLARAGVTPREVEVEHFERVHGSSQFFRPGRVLSSLRDVAGLWWRLVARRGGRAEAAAA